MFAHLQCGMSVCLCLCVCTVCVFAYVRVRVWFYSFWIKVKKACWSEYPGAFNWRSTDSLEQDNAIVDDKQDYQK